MAKNERIGSGMEWGVEEGKKEKKLRKVNRTNKRKCPNDRRVSLIYRIGITFH